MMTRYFFSLLFFITGYVGLAQNVANKLNDYFDKDNPSIYKELVFLKTDKNNYLSGEILWFKVHALNAATHTPTEISKVVYVELVNPQYKAVLQAKIDVERDGGEGSFYIPAGTATGQYLLRAYTNWIKNDHVGLFEMPVNIINTLNSPTVIEENADTPEYKLSFYPEGGYLVEGLSSRIAFHLTGEGGKGVEAHGFVTDEEGNPYTAINTVNFGRGSFDFTPQPQKNYTATVFLPNGDSLTQVLPVVQPAGMVVKVSPEGTDRLKVNIRGKSNQPISGEQVTMAVHARQALIATETAYLDYSGQLNLFIDKSKLQPGVNYITLINQRNNAVTERLVFVSPQRSGIMTVAPDKKSYAAREKVQLSFSSNMDLTADTLYSAVAVARKQDMQALSGQMESYAWLQHDLKGSIESPGFYFSENAGKEEALDLLMLTNGWRRFDWSTILSGNVNAGPSFIPEYTGHIITAKVTNISTGMPAANLQCMLTVDSSPFGIYTAIANENGIVRFQTKDYYGPGEIFLQARGQPNSQFRFEIISPFIEKKSDHQFIPVKISVADSLYLLDKSIAMQAMNIYMADSLRKFGAPAPIDTMPFYGKPEFTYLLDDYKRFTTMEEVLREYVMPVTVGVRNGELFMRIYDEANRLMFENNLLVLLDGVPLDNYNKIFSYDPLKVRKLDVVPRQYMVGQQLFNGIASFTTYDQSFDGFEMNPSIVAIDYEGLQQQRRFYSPDYETETHLQTLPDLRTTLFWQPKFNVVNGEKPTLEFFTGDEKGSYIIMIEGFTAKGKFVAGTAEITVE